MTEYNAGDLVEAVKGETVLRGRLILTGGSKTALPTIDVDPDQATYVDWLIRDGWTVTVVERATPPLPTEPGTVIAIGDWWLVKLRPYSPGQSGAWEFLPVPSSVALSVKLAGQKEQCVYGNDWVQETAQKSGGFTVISEPIEVKS